MPEVTKQTVEAPQPSTQQIADAIGVSVGDSIAAAIAKATGKLGRPPKRPEDWPKQQIPLKTEPGYAVIADRNGRSPAVVECHMIIAPDRGKCAECYPIERHKSGTVSVGSLADKIQGGEVVVVQFTPYPTLRNDGKPHIMSPPGTIPKYPPADQFTFYEGTYFHNAWGAESLRLLKQRKADGNKAA